MSNTFVKVSFLLVVFIWSSSIVGGSTKATCYSQSHLGATHVVVNTPSGPVEANSEKDRQCSDGSSCLDIPFYDLAIPSNSNHHYDFSNYSIEFPFEAELAKFIYIDLGCFHAKRSGCIPSVIDHISTVELLI